jgi:outer membrane protein
MRRSTAILVCFLLLTLTAAGAAAAEPLKVGILDFQKVLETSKAGRAAKEKINVAGKDMETELKQRKEKIEQESKDLERELLVMEEEARKQREIEIRQQMRDQVRDFRELQQRYYNEFKTQEQTLIRKIQKEVFELAEKMGKEEGFSLILERRESAALYFDHSLDITDLLIQRYDKTYSETAEKTE